MFKRESVINRLTVKRLLFVPDLKVNFMYYNLFINLISTCLDYFLNLFHSTDDMNEIKINLIKLSHKNISRKFNF